MSGSSAAAVWGFPDSIRGRVEITAGAGKRSRDFVVVYRRVLHPEDVVTKGGLPVTTPGRTLADIAGRVGRRRFDAAFHHCLHSRLATVDQLRAVVARHQGFRGAAVLRDALQTYSGNPPAASPLEARMARRLRGSSLPPPRRQHEVRSRAACFYLDFAWPDQRVALEVDGYRWHSSRSAWESDRARLAELRRGGWTVVHATKDDIDHGFARLERELAQLLSRRH